MPGTALCPGVPHTRSRNCWARTLSRFSAQSAQVNLPARVRVVRLVLRTESGFARRVTHQPQAYAPAVTFHPVGWKKRRNSNETSVKQCVARQRITVPVCVQQGRISRQGSSGCRKSPERCGRGERQGGGETEASRGRGS